MKVETIVTAIIFLSVGFLAGYVYKAQRQSGVQAEVVTSNANRTLAAGVTTGMGSQAGKNIDPATGLPVGHPPLQVSEIIQNYQQRAEQNPRDPEIPLRLANYLYDQKFYNLAANWYQRSLSINPKNVNARTDLGTSYFYVGRLQKALKEYREALKISPHHEPTLFNMIVVNLEGTHDFRTAEKFCQELDRRNPNYPGLKEIKARLDEALRASGMASPPQ